MKDYPEITKAAMDRMLGIIQLSITKFTRCQSGEARERDMAHYKSKKSSPRHEAQISQFPWMKEQSQLAQRREKAATTHLDNVNAELAIAKMKIEELERDKDQDKMAYLICEENGIEMVTKFVETL